MKLTVIANHHGGSGMHNVGDQREVNENLGKELIEKGLAKEYAAGDEKKYKPVVLKEKTEIAAPGKDGFVANIKVSEKKEKNVNGTSK